MRMWKVHISYLLLYSLHLLTGNNKHLLSQFLWVRNPGVAELVVLAPGLSWSCIPGVTWGYQHLRLHRECLLPALSRGYWQTLGDLLPNSFMWVPTQDASWYDSWLPPEQMIQKRFSQDGNHSLYITSSQKWHPFITTIFCPLGGN